ncbi:unnamed protein product [Didymodactylos carnosus]|uniref:F-box domain-containing protein n=1 Tax=Didymodactylos carnosus TaxID=1234261 RepID=A0A814MJE4_9BILA|nr:unnamed protein product [Didymodactylos carnosus]CAF1080157.1 unnamed protein product [Didymodactylos carnosus]CAF3661879.1 unnamed protein product [Didymodactylos carnosus]CAF3846199.1 unnamed protein product [Didymodactylos carnosus]
MTSEAVVSVSKKAKNVDVTKLEYLSNELLMELLEYIDLYNLCRSFYNQNFRLNALIDNRSVKYRTNLSTSKKFSYFCCMMRNKYNRIISLTVSGDSCIPRFTASTVLDELVALRSLTLNEITTKQLELIVRKLTRLHQLVFINVTLTQYFFSLDIHHACRLLLYDIPSLKSAVIDSGTNVIVKISESLLNISNLDTLTFAGCQSNVFDFIPLVRQMPKLRSLNISLHQNLISFGVLLNTSSFMHFNLVRLNLKIFNLSFDHLCETLKIVPNVKQLSIGGCIRDPIFLTSERWKQLLLHGSLSKLVEFMVSIQMSIADVPNNDEFRSDPYLNQRKFKFDNGYLSAQYKKR